MEHRAEIQPLGFPERHRSVDIQQIRAPDQVLEFPEAQFRHPFAHFAGNEPEELDDVFRPARVSLAQLGILGRHAERAPVGVAFAHHHAPAYHQRRRREPEFLRTQQSAHHHVAPRLDLPVGLQPDPAAQLVQHQRLLRLGQPQFPRGSRMLDARQRRRPRAPVVAADQHPVRARLGHARRHRPHPQFRHQLHADLRLVVRAAQVVDQLRDVLDRIDVVMRRRRDQGHARRGVPHPGDVGRHLVAGQLPALAGLRPLRDLDLQLLRMVQVLRRHPEASAGDLLDRAATVFAVRSDDIPRRILAALAAVAAAAETVHGDRQRFVHLLAQRPETHRARHEPAQDRFFRLDLFKRHRRTRGPDREQPAQRALPFGLVVVHPGVLLVQLPVARPRGLLQGADALRRPQMALAVRPPRVLPARRQRLALLRSPRVRMARQRLPGDLVEPRAPHPRCCPGEVPVQHRLRQPHRLEHLSVAVAAQRRNAHLGHDLHQPLVQRLDVVAQRLGLVGPHRKRIRPDQLRQRGKGQVRIDRRGAEPQQQRHVHHLARLAGFDQQPRARPESRFAQRLVHGSRRQQRRNRREPVRQVPVAQDNQVGASPDLLQHPLAQVGQRALQFLARPFRPRVEAHGHGRRPESFPVQVADPRQVRIGQDRMLQLDQPRLRRAFAQNVRTVSQKRHQRHHQLLADRVNRRIGDLGKQLFEIPVEQLRLLAQHRQGLVAAHRADRLRPFRRHRIQKNADVFPRVAEPPLLRRQRGRRRLPGMDRPVKAVDRDMVFLDPPAVRPMPREMHLDLGILHQPPRGQVRQQHRAGTQRSLFGDVFHGNVQHARLRRQHHEPVLRAGVAHRPQPVAVQQRADQPPVGERHRRRPVPRLHQPGMELEEPPQIRPHRIFRPPRLGDQHQHGVMDLAPAQRQQFEQVVQVRAVAAELFQHRRQPGKIPAEHAGIHPGLARGHGVAVAAQRVDFAVVRQQAERLRQRPRRKRIGRIALMHHRHRAHQPRIPQIRIELRHLRGDHHSLVHQRPARKTRGIGVGRIVLRLAPQLPLRALAHRQQLALQRLAGQPPLGLGGEQVPERRHRRPGHRAHRHRIHRHVAPAQRA